MMVKALREAVRRVIAENPTEITIQRREKIEQDGGFAEQESTAGPFTVRIFQRESSALPQTVSTLAGTAQVDTRWGLIADFEADIRAGSTVVDEFVAFGQRFRIVAVYPHILGGQVISYRADLERVN